MAKIDSLQDAAAKLNNATYNQYYMWLRQMGLSMFEWKGLPESCDARFLEKTLFMMGRAIFLHDDILGYINAKCTSGGNLNHYDLPTQWEAYSLTFNKFVDPKECVIIRNNYDEVPTDFTLQLFARRLYEVERAIDVNIRAQKTPIVIRCDEKQRLSMEQMYMKYDGNIPFIFGDKNSLDTDAIKSLKTDAPFVADKLMMVKHDIINEALTFLGVDNANTYNKKERLIVSEVEGNQDMVDNSAWIMLKTRQIAAAEINKKYDLSVSVELKEFEQEEIEEEGKEENEDG